MGKIDIQKILLEMARRNPQVNQSITTGEALKKYKDDPDIYISYTEVEKIGINPRSGYNTPLGIYCYPLKEMYNNVINNTVPYMSKQPYVWVIKKKDIPNMKFIDDASAYNAEDLEKDIKKIKDKYIVDIAKANIVKYNNKKDLYKNENFKNTTFEFFIEDAIKTTNTKKLPKSNPAFAHLWNITRLLSKDLAELSKYQGYKPPFIWNYVLRSIGYTGMANKRNEEVIHENEPSQAVFFSIQYFDVLEKVINKKTKQYHNTKEITDRLMDKLFKNEYTYDDVINHPHYDPKGLKIIIDRAFREGKEDEIPEDVIKDFVSNYKTSQMDANDLLKSYIKHHKKAPSALLNFVSRYMYMMYSLKVLNKVADLSNYSIGPNTEGKIIDEILKMNLNVFDSKINISDKYIPKIIEHYIDTFGKLPNNITDGIRTDNIAKIVIYMYNKYGDVSPRLIKQLTDHSYPIGNMLSRIPAGKVKPFIKKLVDLGVNIFNPFAGIYNDVYMNYILDAYFDKYGRIPEEFLNDMLPSVQADIIRYYNRNDKKIPDYLIKYNMFGRNGGFYKLIANEKYHLLERAYDENLIDLNEIIKNPLFFSIFHLILADKIGNGEDIRKDQLNTLSDLSASRLFHHMIDNMRMLTKNTAEYMMTKPKLENEMRSMYGDKYEEILKKLGIDVSHQNKQ